jgi:hypothetical protein
MVTQRTIVATNALFTATLLAGLGITLTGCAAEEGRPPIARIAIDPMAIPEHDDFQTMVTLDGSDSADPIDDPDGAHPLDFRWEIIGDEVRFETGSHEDDKMPSVRFRGDRPATVNLTVTDVDGLSAGATAYVQLTVP